MIAKAILFYYCRESRKSLSLSCKDKYDHMQFYMKTKILYFKAGQESRTGRKEVATKIQPFLP